MNLIDDALQSVLIRARRSIGEIVPNVVIEEVHQDALTITEHPVEQGAAIADHAYVRPAEVVMRCGFGPATHSPAWNRAIPRGCINNCGRSRLPDNRSMSSRVSARIEICCSFMRRRPP